ncbi:sensor histidine kinase KdpD, partial [Streptomyces sp. 2MCAF27]
RHSPPDAPPTLTAEALPDRLTVRIAGDTTGAAVDGERESPSLRLSRDLTEAMGGTVEHTAGGGAASVTITLPTVAYHPEAYHPDPEG